MDFDKTIDLINEARRKLDAAEDAVRRGDSNTSIAALIEGYACVRGAITEQATLRGPTGPAVVFSNAEEAIDRFLASYEQGRR